MEIDEYEINCCREVFNGCFEVLLEALNQGNQPQASFMVLKMKRRFEHRCSNFCSKNRSSGPGARCAWCAPIVRLMCA